MAKKSLQQLEHLAGVASYDSKKLARLCDKSVRQLQRDFQSYLKRSPQDWLNEQRIKAAEQLLLAGNPVKKVALTLGFKQASHFSRQFKSQLHLTPSQCAAQAQTEIPCRSQITNVALR